MRVSYVRNQIITTDIRFVRVSYVRNQIITTDSRFVRVSYARNQVITTDSRSEGELRQKPGDHHRQYI